jgi:hypothetical protein
MSRPPPLGTSGRPARNRRPFPRTGDGRGTSPLIKQRVPVLCWQLFFPDLTSSRFSACHLGLMTPVEACHPLLFIITWGKEICLGRFQGGRVKKEKKSVPRSTNACSDSVLSLACLHRPLHLAPRLPILDILTAVVLVLPFA